MEPLEQHAVSMDTAERTSAPMVTSDRVDRSVVRSARNGEEINICIYIYEVEVIYILYIYIYQYILYINNIYTLYID